MKRNVLFSLCFLLFQSMNAQDIHWAHIHASPTYLNPAMNGLFQGDVRFVANARTQWNAFTKGYKTISGSVDTKLFAISKSDFIGAGLQLFSDKAGDLEYATKSAGLSFSYLRSFDDKGRNFISFGIQNNLFNNSVDFSKVESYGTIHRLTDNVASNIYYWSISAGVSWFYAFDRDNSFYIGTSYSHLNNPVVSFINRDGTEAGNLLYRKLILHGGAEIKIADGFDLKPSFLYMDQGPNQEINMGSFLRFKAQKGGSKRPLYKVYLGAWFRYYMDNELRGGDAIIASFRMDYKDVFFTFSYDINVSKLNQASTGKGGPEFSIVKIINNSRKRSGPRRIKCPANFN